MTMEIAEREKLAFMSGAQGMKWTAPGSILGLLDVSTNALS